MASRDMKRSDRTQIPLPLAAPPLLRRALPWLFSSHDSGQHHGRAPRHRPSHHDRRQNKNQVKSRDKYRVDKQNTDEAQVKLEDVEHRLGPYRVSVKRCTAAIKLGAFIKERYRESSGRPLADNTRVRFFADARELGRHDLVDSHPSVWFRIDTSEDSDTWKFTLHGAGGIHLALSAAVVDDLTRCIEAGGTVGQLRKNVAKHLRIVDPDRVVIKTCDGLRKGSLAGDMWELRQIRSWYCRWLSIRVADPRCYIILEGPWGRYLYHPSTGAYGLSADTVKKWVETCLLNSLNRLQNSGVRLEWHQIRLTLNGRRLSSGSSPIRPGITYRFELPWYLEDALAAEESWLLPANETCAVCMEDKKATELPARVTDACVHKPTTCRDCLGQWIHSSIETSTWDRLKCPECPSLLKFGDVRRYASKGDFDRYDTLATRAAVKSIPNFRWCLSASCGSGQIHDPTCKRFKCVACKAKHCTRHVMPWHSRETCEEYDKRNRRRRKDEKASEDMIKKTSKACPECKKAVHKYTGCNHITCICGHDWCYVCLAPFRRNQQEFLFCRHNAGCTETDLLADLIDPAGRRRMPDDNLDRRNMFRAARPPGVGVIRPPNHGPDHGGRRIQRWDPDQWLADNQIGQLVELDLQFERLRLPDRWRRPEARHPRPDHPLEEDIVDGEEEPRPLFVHGLRDRRLLGPVNPRAGRDGG